MGLKVKKNTVILWVVFFLIVAFPTASGNIFENVFTIRTPWFSLSIMEILLLIECLVSFCKKPTLGRNRTNEDLIYSVILIFATIAYIYGRIKGQNALADLRFMWTGYMFYFVIRRISYKDLNLFNFNDKVSDFVVVTILISFVMYITEESGIWGQTRILGEKFGGNYIAILIVVIPMMFFYIYTGIKNVSVFKFLFILIFGLFLVVLADFRSILLLLVIGMAITVVISLKSKDSRISRNNRILYFMIFIVVGIISIKSFLNSDSSLANRLLHISFESKDDSLATRLNTLMYNFSELLKAPGGNGFGYEQPVVNRYLQVVFTKGRFYTDNYFMTIARKFGIIPTILQFVLFVKVAIKMWKLYKVTNKTFYLVYLLSYVLMMIQGTIISAQLYHSQTMIMFIWCSSALIVNETNEMAYEERNIV